MAKKKVNQLAVPETAASAESVQAELEPVAVTVNAPTAPPHSTDGRPVDATMRRAAAKLHARESGVALATAVEVVALWTDDEVRAIVRRQLEICA